MAQSRPSSAPTFAEVARYLDGLSGPSYVFRAVIRAGRPDGRVMCWVEGVYRFYDGREKVAVRFGEGTSLGSDAQVMGALLRSAARARWWADSQGAQLEKRLHWEAGRDEPLTPPVRA